MPEVPLLETERLIIRSFAESDRDDCHRLSHVVWGSEPGPDWIVWASRNLQQLVNLYQPPYGDRAIVLRDGGQLIGQVGLVPALGPFGTLPGFDVPTDSEAARLWTPEVGLFWMLDPDYRGQGYATEAAGVLVDHAFATLNLRRVVATTEHDNTASQAVMRRLGMRLERNPYPEPGWFQTVGVLERPSHH